MTLPIIDLHCDLTFHLEQSPKRTPYDPEARCAIPQLRKGNVKLQTMAIFTETGSHSIEKGLRQLELYEQLLVHYPHEFQSFSPDWNLKSSAIATLFAFENASGFCDENEPLEAGLKRLKNVIVKTKPLYISLTWNAENRFGGGALAKAGLKEDGKTLLETLDQQNIAIDLSHASDALAYEIIDYMEGHRLDIPLMASHSNSRVVTKMARNLPDEIAQELIRRKAIIGLNLYKKFLGETRDDAAKHIVHWLELGGGDSITFGADFFNTHDLSLDLRQGEDPFFTEFANASCYPTLLSFLEKELRLSSSTLEKLAYHNALTFIQELSKSPV